jgi:UDP-glucose 4-epimerase
VLAAFLRRAHAGEPLTIAGTGGQSRRFVYGEDLAEGVVAALSPHAANRTYNLVGDESVTILEIAQLVRELVRPVEIRPPGRAEGRLRRRRGVGRAVGAGTRLARDDAVRRGYVEWWLADLSRRSPGARHRER